LISGFSTLPTFQQALLHQLAGNEHAADDLAANVVRVLDTLKVAGP